MFDFFSEANISLGYGKVKQLTGLQFLFCTFALKFPLRRTGKTCTLIAPLLFLFVQITPRVVHAFVVWIRNIEIFFIFRTRTSDPSLFLFAFDDWIRRYGVCSNIDFVFLKFLSHIQISHHPSLFTWTRHDVSNQDREGQQKNRQQRRICREKSYAFVCVCIMFPD